MNIANNENVLLILQRKKITNGPCAAFHEQQEHKQMVRYNQNVKKSSRREIIKMLVSSMEITTQEELIKQLDIAGYRTSQSTLVRDLKQLRILKGINEEGKAFYMLPSPQQYSKISDTHVTVNRLNRIGITEVRFSGNMGVIHTPPGHAAHVAYDIDNANIPEILGTIAGDDTVFMVLEPDVEKNRILDLISLIRLG